MMKIGKTLLTIAALFSAVTAFSQTIECKYCHVRHIQASDKTIEMSGDMTFVYPDQLTMNYILPEGEYFIINGNEVKINMNGRKSTVNTDKNARMRTQANTLLNCIKGNYEQAAADNNATVGIEEDGDTKTVTLTAEKKSPRGYSRIILTYRQKDNMLLKMVLEEFGGVTNTYTLSDIVTK